MDPLDYLVEDCWLHLFHFLSAEDKQALCDTCATFHAMLQPQKVQWGFELILPHVGQYLRYDPTGCTYRNQKLQSIELKFRLVCKSWRATFDKLICSSNSYFLMSTWTIPEKYNFSNVSKLEKFLNFFKNYQGNPFIGRKVIIYATSAGDEKPKDSKEIEEPEVNEDGSVGLLNEIEEGSDEDEEMELDRNEHRQVENQRRQQTKREMSLKYQQLQMELLSRYGQEIEYLTLNVVDRYDNYEFNQCSELDACKLLQLVLCNTSKLQSLELVRLWHPTLEERTYQTKLVEYFEANPLPNIPTLRELALYENDPIMQTLLLEAYGENLQILRMNNSSEIPLSIWGNMKCLKKLKLCDSDSANNEKILRALHSPLEILSIAEKYETRRHSGQFLIGKFLLAVQHLPLKQVKVRPAWDIVKESTRFPADFPKHFTITEFTFEYVNTISANFLPFLPNLQKLKVGESIMLSFLPNKT